MEEVSIRELRNHGGEVIDRVVAGERLTITRDGKPVAELRRLGPPVVSARALLERWSRLPPVDLARFRRDADRIIDATL